MLDSIGHITLSLAAAWTAGSLIGAERSYNGRAAGFRTHALVGLAAAAAMLTAMGAPALHPGEFPPGDATRVTQGVMTGVGFLGGGVIFKEGISVQGLTTAACIWATAAIGLLFGSGNFLYGAIVTGAVLTTLTLLRVIEALLPGPVYALATFRFDARTAPTQDEVCDLLGRRRVRFFDVSVGLTNQGATLEYRGNLRVHRPVRLIDVADRLRETPGLVELAIARISK